MLNRKLLALVLPAVAVSALVGSGFSAWYFYYAGSYNTENIDVSVSVEDEINQILNKVISNLETNLKVELRK